MIDALIGTLPSPSPYLLRQSQKMIFSSAKTLRFCKLPIKIVLTLAHSEFLTFITVPFDNWATSKRPLVLRPHLAMSLPFRVLE